ncbi:MAG: RNA polymerase sigma factor [Planctomycetales bacterium]|nr:RNA polymerase sigma factor [Planctomycetales bacterium]
MSRLPTDRELMTRVSVGGDPAAYEEIFRRHYGSLVAFFYRMRGERHASEDLAQDAFLRLWKYRSTYKPTGSFVGYLLTLARNVWADRAGRMAPTVVEDEVLDAFPEGRPEPGEVAGAEEEKERVRRAVLDLPEALRAPLVLSRFHGMEYKEIAEVLSISARTVEARISRAMDGIIRRLGRLPSGGTLAPEGPEGGGGARP